MARACQPLMLNRAIVDYKRANPTASNAAAMKNVVKYTVPISLPGSPSWHRKQLNDLLFLVEQWGMPHMFLTLTADESSEMRWSEVADLEKHLDRFSDSFTWEVILQPAHCIACPKFAVCLFKL